MQQRFRFSSIAGLMALVVLIALAFATLKGRSALWASATFTLALALLATAAPAIYACRGSARGAWIGFGAFGWSYLAFSGGPWPNSNGVTAPPFPTTIAYELLRDSTRNPASGDPAATKSWVTDSRPCGEPLWAIDSRYNPPRRISQFSHVAGGGASHAPSDHWVVQGTADAPGLVYGPTTPSTNTLLGDFFQLRRIVHALGAIAFGLIGAAVGWALAAWSGPGPRAEDAPPADL